MNRGLGCFWFWLLMLGGASSRPKPQSNNEEGKGEELITVNITEVDRRNIGLAETMGVNSLDITYPQGIQCVLRKVSSSSPGVRCRQVRVPRCRTVQRLKITNVTEDCGKQAEYCHYELRTQEAQEVTKEAIVCERTRDVTCRASRCPDCPNICHQNPIVVCATEQQKVVITERKQKCGDARKLETIKICFTYPDASWLCKELRNTEDCEPESVRVVSSEIGMPRIMCSKKEQSPICIPAHCSLSSNDTHCLTTQLPIEVDLEDFECEECSHGRTKERQVLVQEEECKDVIQEFCVDNEDEESEWIKTCRVPSNTQQDQLAQILRENTNIINDPRSLQQDGHDASNGILFRGPVRDEYIGTKPTNKVPKSDDTITNMIEGADIFFAKQFFKNTLVENTKGHNTNEKAPTFTVTEPTPLTTSQTTRSIINEQSTRNSHTLVKEYTNKPFVTNSILTTPKSKPIITVTAQASTTEEFTTKAYTIKQATEEHTTKASTITQATEEYITKASTIKQGIDEYTTKASTIKQATEEYTTKASTTAQTIEDYTTKPFKIFPPVTTPKPISTKTSTASTEQRSTETENIRTTKDTDPPVRTITTATRAYTIFTTPQPTKRTSSIKYTEEPLPTFGPPITSSIEYTEDPLPTFGPIFIPPITTEETTTTTRRRVTTAKNIENESTFIYGTEEGISCLRTNECPTGQECIAGSCELVCQNDVSCPSGKSCVNSKCVDHCSNEEACGVNAQCIHHKLATYCSCIPGFIGIPTPREGCVRSQHSCAIVQCPVGYKCERDHCHYQCQESQDCAVGEICSNQKCAKICRSDEHCLIGEFCSSELICKTGCNEDENCHENQLCLNSKCVTIGRENVETTTNGVTRFSSRPTIRFTSETTPSKIPTNDTEVNGSGSGIYFDPNLPFPWAINDQLTTEGTPTVGIHSGINDPTVSIHPGIINGGHVNSDNDICINIKCPFGYRCEQGECISIRGTNEDKINPEVDTTKDNTDKKGTHTVGIHSGINDPTVSINPGINNGGYVNSDNDICINIKCPFGYRCEQGECISIRNTNEDKNNPEGVHSGINDPTVIINQGINNGGHVNSDNDICINIKCPLGYRCEQGECISIQGTNRDQINPEIDTTKDNTNQKENNKQRCLNVRCPPGYRCNTGQCYIYNRHNFTDHELEQKCNDVKCPVGYRCYKGDCIGIASHNGLKPNDGHEDTVKGTDHKNNDEQGCINVLCPAGYKCERGNCYVSNLLNLNDQNAFSFECKNVKCPNGYRCDRGECVDKAAGSFRDGHRNIDNSPTECTDVKCPLGYECEKGRCVDHDITIDSFDRDDHIHNAGTSNEHRHRVDHDITIDSFDRDDLSANSDHIHNAGTSGEHQHHAHTGRHLNHGLHRHKTRFEKKQDSGTDLNDLLLLLGDDISATDLDKVDINNNRDKNIVTNVEITNDDEPNISLHQKNSFEKSNLQSNNKGQQSNTEIPQTTENINQKENEPTDVQNNDQTGLLFLPFTDPLLKRGKNQVNGPRGNTNEQEGDRSTSGKQQFDQNIAVFNTKDDHVVNTKIINLIAHSEIEDKEPSSSNDDNSSPGFSEENDEYRITNNDDNQDILNSENKNQIISLPAFENESENKNNEETNSRTLGNNLFQGSKSNDDLGADYKQIITEGNVNGNAINRNTNKVNQIQNSDVINVTNKEVVNDNINDNNKTTSLLFHPLTEDFLTRTSTELPNQNIQNGYNNTDENVPILAQNNNNRSEQPKDNNKNDQQQGNFNFGSDQGGINIISEGKFEIHSGTSDEISEKSNALLEEQKSDQEHNERDTNCEHIRNEKERITCKVISCFKHKDNCFR